MEDIYIYKHAKWNWKKFNVSVIHSLLLQKT